MGKQTALEVLDNVLKVIQKVSLYFSKLWYKMRWFYPKCFLKVGGNMDNDVF